jgi:hypothetical protein
MFGLNYYSVSLLDSNFTIIIPNMKVKHVPRLNELIYLEEEEQYYIVESVIHNINKKHGIFLIVEKFDK